MKIGFLLGSADISGGTYVIYEHATRLQRLGHAVAIITQNPVNVHQYAWHSSAGELRWLTLEQAGNEQYDIAIATWWQSPFLLKDLDATHFVYFVQSIETRFFDSIDPTDYAAQDNVIWQELCEKTYSFNLPMITEACWIQEYIYENYNTYPFLVRNGIRKDVYSRTGAVISPVEDSKLRVLVEGPVDVAYKNVPTSIKLAKQAGIDEIWLLTSSDIDEYPGVDRVFSRVPIHDTPAIYRSCDVLLKLSYVEGMFGPPLEMFHCGGTAIVYKVTGYDEYLVHGLNSFVVDRDDKDGVIAYLQQLKTEPAILSRLKNGAQSTALQWPDWELCSREFEKSLLEIQLQKPTSRDYLVRYTEELFESVKPRGKARTLEIFLAREENYTKGERAIKDNFVELYWHSKEKFTPEKSLWKHYQNEEWQSLSFEVEVDGFPFWLRIDPSIRIGIVCISSIKVTNVSMHSEVMAFHNPDDFAVLFLWGTVSWLDDVGKNIVFSYGGDPRLVLPAVEEINAAVGDKLKVEIKLKETGIQQFFHEILNRKEQPVLSEKETVSTSWKQKLLSIITQGS